MKHGVGGKLPRLPLPEACKVHWGCVLGTSQTGGASNCLPDRDKIGKLEDAHVDVEKVTS